MTGSNRQQQTPAKPRKLLPAEEALLNELKRTLTVTQDGKSQQISIELAVIRKLEQVALSGSPHALGQLMRHLHKAQQAQSALVEEDIELGMRSLARAKERVEDAIRRRLDPNLVVPHPDDYKFSSDKGWEIDGPWDTEELNIILGNIERRDLMILQATLEERLATKAEWRAGAVSKARRPGVSAWVMVHYLNDGLPARFHLETMDIIDVMLTYERMTKRELLKHAFDKWRKSGNPKPRGWRMETFPEFELSFKRANTVVRDIVKQAKAGRVLTEAEIQRRFSEIGSFGRGLQWQ